MLCKKLARELDVLTGVGGTGLDEDQLVRHPKFNGMFAVVDGFAARKPFDCRGCVSACEDDTREHPLLVQLGCEGGNTKIMTAESDTDIAGPNHVVHVVVIPQSRHVSTVDIRQGHVASSFGLEAVVRAAE